MKEKPKRVITVIIVHCSASDNPAHDNIETIEKWHQEKGFLSKSGISCGYHYFINKKGFVSKGRPENEIGAHCEGMNKASIGVCLSGKDKFTPEQFRALETLCRKIALTHSLALKDILPHNSFNPHKTCPNFNLRKLIRHWKIP